MAEELVGNVLVGQSGGPTAVINASVAGVVSEALNHECIEEIYGTLNGVLGILQEDLIDLAAESQQAIRGLRTTPGAALGTVRYKLKKQQDFERILEVFKAHNIRYFFYAGGNDSQDTADKISKLAQEQGYALRVIGVPKTIDNDVEGTDVCFGFHTAVQTATDAIDRLHTTAESHDRVIVVEVMGRDTGWIATYAGIAGGATAILIPERPFDIDAVAEVVTRRHSRGRYASIVVVAEGAAPVEGTMPAPTYSLDPFGRPRLGGISSVVADALAERTGFDTRVVQIGHVQRGGTPSAFDRVLCTRLGVAATQALHDGVTGQMVAVRNDEIVRTPLTGVIGKTRFVDLSIYDNVASVFFG